MITKEMKVSEVLKNFPETLEVFIETSPHFKKLENKFLRKALASRVTIQQAATIAGVELNELLYKLNKKIHNDYQEINSDKNELSNERKKPEWLEKISEDKIIELDVRPILNSGRDPFLDIMKKVKDLKDDQVLMLINFFEPVPLYTVLGKKGFEHYTIKEENKFKVYFFRKETETQKSLDSHQSIDSIQSEFSKVIELDVRELPPPEPMIKILETLSQVDENTLLLVHHHREPLMLYPKIEERGYEAISNKINDNYYKVLIMKKRN